MSDSESKSENFESGINPALYDRLFEMNRNGELAEVVVDADGEPEAMVVNRQVARETVERVLRENPGLYSKKKAKAAPMYGRCMRLQQPGMGEIHLHTGWAPWNRSKVKQILYFGLNGQVWLIPTLAYEYLLGASSEPELISWLSQLSRRTPESEPMLYLGSIHDK